MWIEKKYIMLLSNQLDKFKQRGSDLWNFRCWYCKDSQQNKNKARGYIFQKKGKYIYHCHNCSVSISFKSFLKQINPTLYDQYILELFENNKQIEQLPVVHKPTYAGSLDSLSKVSQLSPFSQCKKYIVSRQIPTTHHHRLYYCPQFKKFVNSIVPNKFEDTSHDSQRIIIPFYDKDHKLFGFQGRALDNNDQIRYITIMLNQDMPKIYGIDQCDFNKKFYVFEGPFDSMFIPNSIASCGGKIDSELEKLDKCKDNCVIVYDNEPRNKQIVNNISTSIKHGYNVCIWPADIQQKDINDMITKNISGDYVKTELVQKAADKIKEIIDRNTFRGLQAELKLIEWKKV